MGSVADFSVCHWSDLLPCHRSAEFCVIGIFVQSGRFPAGLSVSFTMLHMSWVLQVLLRYWWRPPLTDHIGVWPQCGRIKKRLEKLLKRNDLLFIWKNTQNTGTQAECRSYHTASGRACSYETVSACDRGRRAIYQWIQYCVRCGINCSSRWRRWRIQSPLQ